MFHDTTPTTRPTLEGARLRQALETVAELLDAGQFDHEARQRHTDDDGFKGQGQFDMNTASCSDGCGTIACIGGWAWLLSCETPLPNVFGRLGYSEAAIGRAGAFVKRTEIYPERNGPGLERLFYPPRSVSYDQVTPAQAAIAIRNYLDIGDPNWNGIPDLAKSHWWDDDHDETTDEEE